ncbi:MAG: pseudouridine synthase [Hyphomonas sp.]
MRPARSLAKYLAGLGYGSRKDMETAIADGRVTGKSGDPFMPRADWPDFVEHLSFDGDPLDPPPGMILMLHKPTGYTCSRADQGQLVYELLPPRFLARKPALSSIGRLDADTSGLLLFTDDGPLLHRLISPKSNLPKTYDATLARPLEGHEADLFDSGELVLRGETKPILPAKLEVTGDRSARLTLTEGRYHQVRRMFAAAGNHVETLHRSQFGPLTLGDLPAGHWRLLTASECTKLHA